jgi:Rrf2 family iron-sulfur cluster assembly transcriptional regulator
MRLEITRKADLALRAMQVMAASDEPVKGKELAETIGTTVAFIAQVMKPLVDQGWVESDRGPKGGYLLVGDTSNISVLELIESIEGPTQDGRCVLKGTPCPVTEHCALHDAWTRAQSALLTELSTIPINDHLTKKVGP